MNDAFIKELYSNLPWRADSNPPEDVHIPIKEYLYREQLKLYPNKRAANDCKNIWRSSFKELIVHE